MSTANGLGFRVKDYTLLCVICYIGLLLLCLISTIGRVSSTGVLYSFTLMLCPLLDDIEKVTWTCRMVDYDAKVLKGYMNLWIRFCSGHFPLSPSMLYVLYILYPNRLQRIVDWVSIEDCTVLLVTM